MYTWEDVSDPSLLMDLKGIQSHKQSMQCSNSLNTIQNYCTEPHFLLIPFLNKETRVSSKAVWSKKNIKRARISHIPKNLLWKLRIQTILSLHCTLGYFSPMNRPWDFILCIHLILMHSFMHVFFVWNIFLLP